MARTVAVLGGGVAGLSAAHELAERGFAVSVYESRDIFGGKARSFGVPGSGAGGRADLPAEHGFRFFPGFYKHLPDTMRRIPFPGRADGVAGNLVTADPRAARAGRRAQRAARRHARGRLARRPLGREPLPARLGDPGRDPRARARALRRAAADAADELRRTAARAVRAPELVGVLGRRAAQREVREVPRRRAHPHARRRTRARDERAHRRPDPAPAPLRPHPRRRPRRPRARRADPGGVAHAVGGAPRRPRRGAARGRAGRGDRVRRAPDHRRAREPRRRRSRPSASPPTTTSPRSRSSSCGSCSPPSCAAPSPRSRASTGWSRAG